MRVCRSLHGSGLHYHSSQPCACLLCMASKIHGKSAVEYILRVDGWGFCILVSVVRPCRLSSTFWACHSARMLPSL